jgi:hypothetical protein
MGPNVNRRAAMKEQVRFKEKVFRLAAKICCLQH